MINLWKSLFISISLLFIACNEKVPKVNYKHEERLRAFLQQEKVPTNDVLVYFIMQADCPCVQASLQDLSTYKQMASKAYLFSNFNVDDIPEISSFGFNKMNVFDGLYYEKSGLNIVTPKVFIIKNNKIESWKNY